VLPEGAAAVGRGVAAVVEETVGLAAFTVAANAAKPSVFAAVFAAAVLAAAFAAVFAAVFAVVAASEGRIAASNSSKLVALKPLLAS
jgi:hypothetical protein